VTNYSESFREKERYYQRGGKEGGNSGNRRNVDRWKKDQAGISHRLGLNVKSKPVCRALFLKGPELVLQRGIQRGGERGGEIKRSAGTDNEATGGKGKSKKIAAFLLTGESQEF